MTQLMSKRILFFINPVSGTKSKASLEEAITQKCKKENAWFEILYTRADGNYNYLLPKIKQDKVTTVVICGGDGSLSPVVKYLRGTGVNLGIIPLGSGNGLARTAGISNNINKALDTIFTGEPAFIDAFTVNNILGCQISGLGYDAYVAKEFAKKRKRGLSTYTKLAISHFFKAKPYHFDVEFNEQQLSVEAFMICVSNANQFGNNLKIAPMASMQDGLLDIIIVKKIAKIRLLWSVMRHLLTGQKTDMMPGRYERKNVLYFNTRSIIIHNKGGAPLHIDGDPSPPVESCHFQIMPSAYKLIHPKL